jgi:hypothetical protein
MCDPCTQWFILVSVVGEGARHTRRLFVKSRVRLATRDGWINPHLGIISYLGCATIREADVLAVDEYVDVTADIVLLVEHALPNTRIIAAEHHDRLADCHAHVEWQAYLDDFVVAGPSTERRWNMKTHRDT